MLYLIGSLRNPAVVELGNRLRAIGLEVFDDWMAAGPEADDMWQKYETERGRTYGEALKGEAAKNVYQFDKRHLDAADIGVLVMPAGKSGHLELGYLAGKGKATYVLFDKEPERWDCMYQFATDVFFDVEHLIAAIGGQIGSGQALSSSSMEAVLTKTALPQRARSTRGSRQTY